MALDLNLPEPPPEHRTRHLHTGPHPDNRLPERLRPHANNRPNGGGR